MDLAQLIRWLVTVSLLLMVFGLGLRATWADATFLIRHLFQPPHRLLRAIVVMFIVVPAIFYCELEHGKLLRVRAFFDLYGAAVQLGVLPARGTLGEKTLLMLRGFGLRTGH